jgi:radical SAM-linked protein
MGLGANTRFRFRFRKTGPMIYISHLDLMRLFARSLRRADLPIALSQGFTPRPRLSVARAGRLGVELFDQEGELILREPVAAGDIQCRWQAALPRGIDVAEFALAEGHGSR